MLRVTGIKITIDQKEKDLKNALLKKLKINESDLIEYRIYKESIDARKRDQLYFVYTIDVDVKNEDKVIKKCKSNDITVTPNMEYQYVHKGDIKLNNPPVIIGFGPAGLFAGLILAEMGYCPIILERGKNVDDRAKDVEHFWKTGELVVDSNVQFGEGGAGTFSDGKLTTQIKDPRCRKILEEFIEAGAPEEILYSSKPHVGTDILQYVVKNIRKKIISLGGEVFFESKATDFIIDDGKVSGVQINKGTVIDAQAVVVAVGHSARDTFEAIYESGLEINQKPFSIGVRIEHPQEIINQSQYGTFADHPRLGAADYKLVHHCKNGRSVYTFCMCPGGTVVASASEEGGVVTNGMSEHARDKENANSALLVGVGPEDFGSDHPLAGMYFQRKLEQKAFVEGGSNYHAPAQLVGDFLDGKPSTSLGKVNPSYTPGIKPTDLKNCLPTYVVEAFKEALVELDKRLKGFGMKDAIMTGVETRSSSPIRIVRDENLESNIHGIYPSGEGAGYAGGIVSAAVDGIKIAEAIAEKFAPSKKLSI